MAATGALASATDTTSQRPRTHLHEIDLTRAVTALSVIAVHVAAYTLVLAVTPIGQQLQNAAIDALHFTREIFLAITAFVLTYSYANRPFSARAFWRKRGLGVLLPYIIWSLFYEVFTRPELPPANSLLRTNTLLRVLSDLLTGHASWQLYYILLTIEFYLILPWFLRFIEWAGKRPWLLLGASFAVQVALLALDYAIPQSSLGMATGLGLFIDTHQDRFLPIYEFYIICGALAALYLRQVQAFLLRHATLIVAGLVAALALLWANFFYQVNVEHQAATYANSVYQPAMAVYGLAICAFIYWIAVRWATSRAPRPPRGAGFWLLLSNISFGIYLMHAYFVDLAVQYVIPKIPRTWPLPLGAVLVYVSVASCTLALCVLFLYVPGLSRLIGRPCALRRDVGIGRWLDERAEQVYGWLRPVLAHVWKQPTHERLPLPNLAATGTREARQQADMQAESEHRPQPVGDFGAAGRR